MWVEVIYECTMHDSIPTLLTIAREVLESNHPDAIVKTADPGECDFRVGAVGASVSVTDVRGGQFTAEDRVEIADRVAQEVSGRNVEYRENSFNEDMHTFDLVSE